MTHKSKYSAQYFVLTITSMNLIAYSTSLLRCPITWIMWLNMSKVELIIFPCWRNSSILFPISGVSSPMTQVSKPQT